MRNEPIKLLDVLCRPMQPRSQCSVPVDKIYSVVGVLSNFEQTAIQPDYGSPDYKIFQQIAQILIQSTHRLEFLCMVVNRFKSRSSTHPKICKRTSNFRTTSKSCLQRVYVLTRFAL
jgi:hypothetical protein